MVAAVVVVAAVIVVATVSVLRSIFETVLEPEFVV